MNLNNNLNIMPKKGESVQEKKEAKEIKETTKKLEKTVGGGKEVVIAVLDKMNTLFTSGMGLVAALAWNEAVKDIFDRAFATQDKNSMWAKFGYAVVVTVIIVMVTYRLTKFIEKIKKDAGMDDKKKKEE